MICFSEIGAVYHQELMDKLEKEKLDAISSAVEQSEKQAAEKLKAEVEKLHEYATADRERALRQQKIVHDQQLTVGTSNCFFKTTYFKIQRNDLKTLSAAFIIFMKNDEPRKIYGPRVIKS